MKRQVLWWAIAVFAWTAALTPCLLYAQPGGGPGGSGGPSGFGGRGGGGLLSLVTREEVQQELQLVDEQQDKVMAVADKMRIRMRDEMRDLFGQMRDLSDEERQARFDEIRARLEAMNADVEAELQKVLLPHQFDRLKQIDVQARLQQSGAAALTSGKLAEALNLTAEQREKLQQRAAEVQQELQAKVQQLRLEARNKLLDVLTAEQRTKLDQLMGEQFALPEQGPGFGGPGGRGGRGGFRSGPGAGDRPRGGERGAGQRPAGEAI